MVLNPSKDSSFGSGTFSFYGTFSDASFFYSVLEAEFPKKLLTKLCTFSRLNPFCGPHGPQNPPKFPPFRFPRNPLTFSSLRFSPGKNWLAKSINGAGLFLISLKSKFLPLKSKPSLTSSSEVIRILGTWEGCLILMKA